MLLLFDIDGTLLAGATRAHAQALEQAIVQVHRVHTRGRPRNFSPAGRTDGEIARLLLLQAGVSADRIDEQADAVRHAACEIYARTVPEDLSEFVLAGIPELLEWLVTRDDVVLGLVTGNFEPIARVKLARAGVGKPFAGGPGGFGSDSEDRSRLPGVARRRAGTEAVPFARE
jgi:phosphoglycolate phosphatase